MGEERKSLMIVSELHLYRYSRLRHVRNCDGQYVQSFLCKARSGVLPHESDRNRKPLF
jgi:hypothetical protein